MSPLGCTSLPWSRSLHVVCFDFCFFIFVSPWRFYVAAVARSVAGLTENAVVADAVLAVAVATSYNVAVADAGVADIVTCLAELTVADARTFADGRVFCLALTCRRLFSASASAKRQRKVKATAAARDSTFRVRR